MENCATVKKAIKEISGFKIIEMAMGAEKFRFLDHAITRTWRKEYIQGHMNLTSEDIPSGELWAYPYSVYGQDIENLKKMNKEYGIGFEILSPDKSEYGHGTWKVILREPVKQ